MTNHDSEELEIGLGRRSPYTQVGDWVMLANIRHASKVLYWALSAHVNSGRRRAGDTAVWPTQEALAQMLGYSRADKIRPLLAELVAIDAIEIEKVPVAGGGNRERSVYTVHQTPPGEFVGFESLAAFHAARRAGVAPEMGGRRDLKWGPGNGEPGPQMGSRSGASNGVPNKTNSTPDEKDSGGGVSGVRHHAREDRPVDNPPPLPASSVETATEPVPPEPTDGEAPNPWCPEHPGGTTDSCAGCGAARRARNRWEADTAKARAAEHRAEIEERNRAEIDEIQACHMCDADGFSAPAVKCLHDPHAIETARRGAARVRAVLAAKTRTTTETPSTPDPGPAVADTAPETPIPVLARR